MGIALQLALAITCTAMAVVAPPARAQNTPEAVKAACNPGADPKEPGSDYPGGVSQAYGGLTPISLPGATTISVREAKCMMDRFPDYIVIFAAMDDERRLPNANPAGWAARPEPEVQARFAQVFGKALGGDKTRPLIFYCHNIRCFMSYNAALRAVQAGYASVYWMREGTAGWAKAGYAFAPRPPQPGEQTLSPGYIDSLADCRKSYATYTAEDWAGLVHQMATEAEQTAYFRKVIADGQNMFKICMENARREYTGAADKADADKVLAGGAAEVEKAYVAARSEMEANPAKYLTMNWDSHKPTMLKADLAILRNGKSLAEACGTFDLSPATGRACL